MVRSTIGAVVFAVISLCFSATPTVAEPGQKVLSVTSPNGTLHVDVMTDNGELRYAVRLGEDPVIAPSVLGMRYHEKHGYDQDLQIVASRRNGVDKSWEQPWGERRQMREHYNQLNVTVASGEADIPPFQMTFRVFDDGIGFRYELPDRGKVALIDELTEFRLDPNGDAFWIPADRYNRYEYIYNQTPIRAVEKAHTPITARLPNGVHLSLHEAALIDFPSMSVVPRRDGVLEAELRGWPDGIKAKKNGAFHTPWRTIQIGRRAIDLVNSDLILNLNAPNVLGDVSWVEPGKYIGIWWGMHVRTFTWGSGPIHGATTDNAKAYIDFAAAHGFDGVLIEGWNIGWDGDWFSNGDVFSFTESYPDFDIEAVAAYALERGVRLIGHHETSGNISNYEAQLDDAFDLYEALGVRQVKTGYVADAGDVKRLTDAGVATYEWHDSQIMVRHHQKVVEAAAQRKISINPHEPIKDTGLRRTYPNWISREGARGQEYNAWGYPHLNPPSHVPMLIFTRMLSGPMDFTPGIFDLQFDGPEGDNRVQTTLAKQLALYVALYSPIQMAADLPENYRQNMAAFQFIKDVPTDWETSIALQGEIAEYAVIARQDRASQDWYLGAVTDEDAREISVPLDFLDADRTYTAQIYSDGADADWQTNPLPVNITERELGATDILTLKLAPGGGAAVRFVAQQDGA